MAAQPSFSVPPRSSSRLDVGSDYAAAAGRSSGAHLAPARRSAGTTLRHHAPDFADALEPRLRRPTLQRGPYAPVYSSSVLQTPDWEPQQSPKQHASPPLLHYPWGGVLDYMPQAHGERPISPLERGPQLSGETSRTELLPQPVHSQAQQRSRTQRVIEALQNDWRPDLLLALSMAGRICYGFGPILIEQQLSLSPDTSNNPSSSTAVPSTRMTSAQPTITPHMPYSHVNGTQPGGPVVTTQPQAWTYALALLGCTLGVSGALGFFLDALKLKRWLAITCFSLHLVGIVLITTGHIVNDEWSRHLPPELRLIAALPLALGSGFHWLTIPLSYSACKYLRAKPVSKKTAATNLLVSSPLRLVAGTLTPVWAFSLVYPVNPFVRDSLSILSNVTLVYAFSLPLTDLRSWIGGAPPSRKLSAQERAHREYLTRAAMGGLLRRPTPEVLAAPYLQEADDGQLWPAEGQSFAMQEFALPPAEPSEDIEPLEPPQGHELKRVQTI